MGHEVCVLGNIKMSLVTMLFSAARDQMVPRYPGTLTVSVNNKNVEIDPVVLPTEASTHLSCRHVHPNLVHNTSGLS